MSPGSWMAIAMLAVAPVAAAAQDKSPTMDPSDPAAAAAAYRYESVFSRYRPVPETEEAPAQAWRAANEEMGRLGGHAGHLNAGEAARGAADPAPTAKEHHGMDHHKGK